MGERAGTPQELSDEELVLRVKAGDEQATRVLFERHVQEFRARVRRRLPKAVRRKVAESDVIQEAYLAAFLAIGDFEERGDGSFARWLHTVLQRKILDEVRRYEGAGKRDVRREVPAGSSVVRMAGASPDPSPSAAAMHIEERGRLLAAMEGLPGPQRTALRLVYEEHLSLADAAARMKRSPEAVRKLYGRAVLALSARMGSPHEPPG